MPLMHSNILALFAGLSALAAAVPTVNPKEPCAQVSHLAQQMRQDAERNPQPSSGKKSFASFPEFPGELVHECMRSMPFDSKRGTAFIEELRKYLQFHSTTETLKNPPSGYLSPPADLFGGFDRISQQAADNKYTCQEDFDTDISNLLISAYDSHLSAEGFCSQALFFYHIPMPMVSISTDGLETPEIYAAADLQLLKTKSRNVSPLVSVDDQDAVSFFQSQALKQQTQDPDARYNSLFKTFNRGGLDNFLYSDGTWQSSSVWPGKASYNFTFGNGTTRHVETKAMLLTELKDFNFPNGKALFNKICVPRNQTSSSTTARVSSAALISSTPTPTPSSTSSAIPRATLPANLGKPVVKGRSNGVSGFYVHEKGLQDVAVLLVSSFSIEDVEQITSFVDTVSEFLGRASDDGKKKLVIDVTGNTGGLVDLAYDLFKQLFPTKPIYSAGRFRSHEAMDFLGRSFAHATERDDILAIRNLGLPSAVTPNQTYHFQSWKELNGPHEILGVNVSSLNAANFSIVGSDESPIHGYGSYKFNDTTSPFDPENIVLVTDGFCASACSILAENLKWQGVKNIVFGGRPQSGPMQAVGGVKGSQVASMLDMGMFMEIFYRLQENSVKEGNPIFTKEELERFEAIAPVVNPPPLSLNNFHVNILNQYAPGDDDTPLQFVYEPADCRLFYTADNINSPPTIWSTAAHNRWNNGSCVDGSTGAKPSESISVSFSLSAPSATPYKGSS